MTKNKAQQVMNAFYASCLGKEPTFQDDKIAVAEALEEAVNLLSIDPDPDKEFTIDKHNFIKGQNWVKEKLLKIAEELKSV